MEFSGKIHIRELEKKPIQLTAVADDKWIQAMLATSAPDSGITGLTAVEWANEIKDFNVSLQVEKMGSEYLVTGQFKGKVPSGCSRCGDKFWPTRETEFRVALVRTEKAKSMSDDELDSGDPDFVYFFGDEIDLKGLLREQLIVLEPVAECPPQDELGKCRLCEKNPTFVSLDASYEKPQEMTGQGFENSAFSSLSNLIKTRK